MTMRKIAVYCRVSTDDQADNGYNLREQEKRCDQYLQAYSDDFTEEVVKYIDDGFSAKDLKRREMIMLLEDIENGLIGKIIIHNLDRLTRSMKDLIYLIELFEKHDVQLFSLKEKIDTDTAMGRFFVSMIILMAQWEREVISERTIRAMDQSTFEGNYVNGKAPFGYVKIGKKLAVDEDQSAVVKQMYHMYQFNNDSISKIQHYHSNKHQEYGFIWTHDRVKNILTNELYTGTYSNKRIRVENHSPQIISKELFAMVQKSMKFRNRTDSHDYLYKSLCIDNDTKEVLKHRSVVKARKIYLYYENNAKYRINQNFITEQITPFMNEWIDKLIASNIRSNISTLNRKDRRLRELDFYYDHGIIGSSYYIKTKNSVLKEITDIEDTISKALQNKTSWIGMSKSQKRKFLMMNVKKIRISIKDKSILIVQFKND